MRGVSVVSGRWLGILREDVREVCRRLRKLAASMVVRLMEIDGEIGEWRWITSRGSVMGWMG